MYLYENSKQKCYIKILEARVLIMQKLCHNHRGMDNLQSV